jgi:hypothetical protein
MHAVSFIFQQPLQGGFMGRLGKWALPSAAMFMVFAGTVSGTTRQVPTTQYPTIQSAINASSSTGGDIVLIISQNITDNGFTVNKPVKIQGNAYYTYFYETGTITVSVPSGKNVTFQYLAITSTSSTSNLIKTNASTGTVDFLQCYFYGGSGSSNYVVDDWGIGHIYGYISVFTGAGTGIDALNTGYVYLNQGGVGSVNKGINYRNNSTSSGPYAQMQSNTSDCQNSNGYIIRTSFPFKTGTNWVGVSGSYLTANGAGSVPIKLDGHSGADIINNTFLYCPTGKEWAKTSTDVIQSASGNTAAPGSNCSAGPM